MKPSLELVISLTESVVLTPTWYSSSFGPDPQIFRSSFESRKGHFSTVPSSEELPSPTESHSPGVKQSPVRISGPIGKSFLIITTSLKTHSPEKGGLSVYTRNLKKERALWRGLRLDHQKSAQWKQEWRALEFKLPDVLKRWGASFQFHFLNTTLQKNYF